MNAAVVTAADQESRRLLRRHYENFWVSSVLIPRDLRPHLARIYTYCRRTDDIGDESPTDATAALLAWRGDVLRCFDHPPAPRDPFLTALAETIARFQLPREPFLDLIEANRRDQQVHEYGTIAELLEYCRYSAAPVGRMVLRLFGIADDELDRLSDRVCIGLQLANFAQDVSVDRQKGRTYLVQDVLQREGLPAAVRSMCRQAAALLESGHELEARVPLRLRIQLSLYRQGGQAILRAIRHLDYRTDLRRPEVSNAVKVRLLLSGLAGATMQGLDAHQYRPA
jgi:squalene synthase HpnC